VYKTFSFEYLLDSDDRFKDYTKYSENFAFKITELEAWFKL
jgi:hypothetical protein